MYPKLYNIHHLFALKLPKLPKPYFWYIHKDSNTKIATVEIRKKRPMLGSRLIALKAEFVHDEKVLEELLLNHVAELQQSFQPAR